MPTKTKPLIPDVAGLTNAVRDEIGTGDQKPQQTLDAVMARLKGKHQANINIENVLSLIRGLKEVVGTTNHDGLSEESLDQLDQTICAITSKVVGASLPSEHTPYHQLATWISAIQRHHPVELFTSNYDLLLEQALEERQVPYFDGFVGSNNTFFDLPSIEQDGAIPSRWARLWKIHGSINWRLSSSGRVERRSAESAGGRIMIYPSHLKYDESRRMPYLAMLDRLRAYLSRGQAILVTCGYSFADQHVNDVILQALAGNPNAICFALIFGDRASAPEALSRARRQRNLNVLAADGAVIGTNERRWAPTAKPDHPLHRLAVVTEDLGSRSLVSTDEPKFILGDFSALGAFLATEGGGIGSPREGAELVA